MQEILLVSSNKKKIEEINQILGDSFKVVSLKDIGFDEEIVEDGTTFEENASIKVNALKDKFSGLIIADDSGLEVKSLNNEPGIYSARYLGEDTSYDIKNKAIIERLIPYEDKAARFVCVIALYDGNHTHTFRGEVNGVIASEILGNNGFGYDPIFIPNGYENSMAELGKEIKNKISHRHYALEGLNTYIKENFTND